MLVRLGKMSPVTFHFFSRTVVAVFLAACLWPQAARSDTVTPQQRTWETQIGQQRFMQYEQRGEIVPQQSPLYQTLDPIGKAIASVADPQYFAPFHFVLLNQGTPNAVAMPGGNVYVATSMLSFLRNQDELAGVLCHEVNHDIHHDVFDIYQATQGGRTAHDPAAIASERQAETNADRAGAYTCAKAGFNPWGMVWNLRLHGQALNGAQQASNADHPSDAQRTADLIALFQSDPATFAKYRDNVAMAKPLNVPAQVSRQYAYQQPQQYQQYSAAVPAAIPAAVWAISAAVSAIPAAVRAIPATVSAIPAAVRAIPATVSAAIPAAVRGNTRSSTAAIPAAVRAIPAAVRAIPAAVSAIPAAVSAAIPAAARSVPATASAAVLSGLLKH